MSEKGNHCMMMVVTVGLAVITLAILIAVNI